MGASIRRVLGLMPFVCLSAISSGCDAASNLVPRTYATSVSPDGRHTASVWRAPSIDPPDDHLYLASSGQAPQLLMNLAPDADWCKTIIWTADSRKVGFLVADDRLAVFNVATRALEAFFFLAGTGCCGGPQESRNVVFEGDGAHVSFDRFDRATVRIRSKDGKDFEAAVSRVSPDGFLTSRWPLSKPARNLGREVVRVPVSHLRLRLVAAPGDTISASISVGVVLADRRRVEVSANPAEDGLVVLPAIDDGPIDRLEIGASGLGGKRIVVNGVRGGGDINTVSVPPRNAG